MEQEQMDKQFYCKPEGHKTMFVSHCDKKGIWIYTNCRYTTSNPQEELSQKNYV